MPAEDLAVALPTEHGTIQIAWRHRECGVGAAREVSRQTAAAIYHWREGHPINSPDEYLLKEWELELTEDLTVETFKLAWAFQDRNRK